MNLFLRYLRLKHERLADVPKHLQIGHWFILNDVRERYHHVPLHADSWTYLGIDFEGQVLAYTHMPFGEASAPGGFTTLMGLMGEVCVPCAPSRTMLAFLFG